MRGKNKWKQAVRKIARNSFPSCWSHLQQIHIYLGSARNSWQTSRWKTIWTGVFTLKIAFAITNRMSVVRPWKATATWETGYENCGTNSPEACNVIWKLRSTDYTGSRICALKERADVQGLRFVSKIFCQYRRVVLGPRNMGAPCTDYVRSYDVTVNLPHKQHTIKTQTWAVPVYA